MVARVLTWIEEGNPVDGIGCSNPVLLQWRPCNKHTPARFGRAKGNLERVMFYLQVQLTYYCSTQVFEVQVDSRKHDLHIREKLRWPWTFLCPNFRILRPRDCECKALLGVRWTARVPSFSWLTSWSSFMANIYTMYQGVWAVSVTSQAFARNKTYNGEAVCYIYSPLSSPSHQRLYKKEKKTKQH